MPTAAREVDPYAVLGVRRGANENELKAAYKLQSVKCHPDAVGGSQEAFQLLQAAYEEVKRRAYEEQWGTSSSAIGSGIAAPLKQITWKR